MISRKPSSVIAEEGQNVSLVCQATGQPAPRITWRKAFSQSKKKKTTVAGKLTILNITKADDGAYVCEAKNFLGEDTAVVQVTVLDRLKFTLIPPVRMVVSDLSNVILNCRAMGSLEIVWRRAGQSLPQYSNGTLLLRSVSSSDAGTYTCVAKNSRRSIEVTSVLEVFPFSCSRIKSGQRGSSSGNYMIDPDGTGVVAPFNVYCDMTTDDDAGDSEPAGGWTLVMKQKSGDGETLQGDNSYWTDENYGTLNDADSNLNENDENLVSKAFTAVPVSDRLMLKAGNEAEVRTEIQAYSHAFNAFQSPVQYSDDVNGINPDWFIQATTYPNTQTITSARSEIKHEQIRVIKTPGRLMCAVRWGWTANQDPIGDDQGSHDSCGGLGAYGYMYGRAWMNNDKNIWQPAALYLYVK